MHLLKTVIVIGIVLVALYFMALVMDAWLETKAAPREPMFFCPKHGMMRKENTIVLIDVTKEPMCPMCFHETMQKASKSPILK